MVMTMETQNCLHSNFAPFGNHCHPPTDFKSNFFYIRSLFYRSDLACQLQLLDIILLLCAVVWVVWRSLQSRLPQSMPNGNQCRSKSWH